MEKKCCVFEKSEEEFVHNKSFIVVKEYADIDAPGTCKRLLLKCQKCGALFLYQSLDWNDSYYEDYIQVEDEKGADRLNQELPFIGFGSSKHHMIKIGSDRNVLFQLSE